MSTELVTLEVRDAIATLTLNRPDVRNAMTAEMGRCVEATVARINAMADVRVVVVTGAEVLPHAAIPIGRPNNMAERSVHLFISTPRLGAATILPEAKPVLSGNPSSRFTRPHDGRS